VISKENVRAHHEAYGAAVYELYARTKKLQEQERERERERGSKRGWPTQGPETGHGRHGTLAARRRLGSFVAPSIGSSGSLRFSRRMKYTSTLNGLRSLAPNIRIGIFGPRSPIRPFTLSDHCRATRRGVSTPGLVRSRKNPIYQ